MIKKSLSEMSPEEISLLIYELKIHQIEIEMRNQELLRIKKELEEARDNYSYLYDFALVGKSAGKMA